MTGHGNETPVSLGSEREAMLREGRETLVRMLGRARAELKTAREDIKQRKARATVNAKLLAKLNESRDQGWAEVYRLQATDEDLRRQIQHRDDIISLMPNGDRHAYLLSEITGLEAGLAMRTIALREAIVMAQDSIPPLRKHYNRWRAVVGWHQLPDDQEDIPTAHAPGGAPTKSVLCSAVPCHCGGQVAKYIITYKDGSEEPVSTKCADMHIAAGYECRPLKAKAHAPAAAEESPPAGSQE